MIAYIFKSFQAHDQISGGDYCSTNQDKKGPTYGMIIIVVILDYWKFQIDDHVPGIEDQTMTLIKEAIWALFS